MNKRSDTPRNLEAPQQEFTVMQLVDFKLKLKRFADAPEQKDSLEAIIATRAALDLDHLARIISKPAIDCGTFWVQVTPKTKKDAKKMRMLMKRQKMRR